MTRATSGFMVVGSLVLSLALPVRADLVTHLSFDGDLLDPISGNNGTFVGGAPAFVDGHDGTPGGALSFDGVDDYVRLSHTSGLPLRQHVALTVALWVKGGLQNDRRLFSEGSSTSNTPLYNVGTDNTGATGAVDIFIREDGTNSTRVNHFKSGTALDGMWHHVAVTDDNGRVRVYVDAVLTGTVTYTRNAFTSDRTSIGAVLRAAAGNYFTGAIDDVRLYSHALSLGEILDLVPVPAGCITHLSLDGTLLDPVSGNNGTFVGAAETYVPGHDGTPGGALSFDGASYVRLAHTMGLPLRQHPALSIAMWVTGGAQGDRRIFSESNASGNNTPLYNLGTDNTGTTGAFDVFIREDANGTQVNHHKSLRPAYDNTWHHVALVDDNGKLTVYIDGTREGTAPSYTRGVLTVDTTTLGGILRATAGAFFTGAIDDVRLYRRAIPPEEVRWLAKEPADCPDVGDTTCTALVAAGPGGTTEPGEWTFTVQGAADESLDPIWYIVTADNGLGDTRYIGPQAAGSAVLVLGPGHWRVAATVDDQFLCLDAAPSQVCTTEVDVVAVPRTLARLPLDGDLTDVSGNGNDGSIAGGDPGFVRGVDCVDDGALAFDGVDDIVRIAQNDGLPVFNTFQYSVALWVKGMPQVDKRVYSEGNSQGNNNPLFNIGTDNLGTTGVVDIFIRNDTGGALVGHVKSTQIAFDGTWHHIAWVDNNGTGALYIDGVLDATAFAYAKTAFTLDTSTVGGILRAAAGSFFAGEIDDVVLVNYLLTQAEIQAMVDARVSPCLNPQFAADCNQDGSVSITDVVCYIGSFFPGFFLLPTSVPGLPCPGSLSDGGNMAVLNINGDAVLNISDIVYLANYLFRAGPPPAQGTGCFGVPEDLGCGTNVSCAGKG